MNGRELRARIAPVVTALVGLVLVAGVAVPVVSGGGGSLQTPAAVDPVDGRYLVEAAAPDGSPITYGASGSGTRTTGDCTVSVLSSRPLQAAIDAAPDGAVLCVETSDRSATSLRIERPLTVRAVGTVRIRSVVITGRDVTLDGFTVVGGALDAPRTAVYFSGSGHTITNNLIKGRGIRYAISCNGTTCGDDVLISRNTITGTHNFGVFLYGGERITVANNNIYDLYTSVDNDDVDAMRIWGTGHVVRNNYVHDLNAARSVGDQHVDCLQGYQSGSRELSDLLVENNYCVRVSGQCLIVQNSSSTVYRLRGLVYRGNVCESYGFQNVELAGVRDVAIESNVFNGGVTGNVLSFKTSSSGLRTTNVGLRNNIVIKARPDARYIAGAEYLADNTSNVLLVDPAILTAWRGQQTVLTAPPARVDSDFSVYRQRAQAGPVVDRAAPPIVAGLLRDVDGEVRVLGGRMDIGPYELG